MLGGSYYIWMMLGVFLSCGGLIVFVSVALWIGHWLMKRETGEKHGFLELPENLRSRPADERTQPPAESPAPTEPFEAPESPPPSAGEENETPP